MKNLLAGMAVVAVLCGVSGMEASAAVRDRDVNNDGIIDILDVITLNRYLGGMFYVSNPAEMDANGDYIIDIGDSYCIQAYTINLSYSRQAIDVVADTSEMGG